MTYLIKTDAGLGGFTRVEANNLSPERRADYEAQGFRSVNQLEFELAWLVGTHGARQVIRIARELAEEMGEEID